jgi:hypothetical protein
MSKPLQGADHGVCKFQFSVSCDDYRAYQYKIEAATCYTALAELACRLAIDQAKIKATVTKIEIRNERQT